jgi:hypothetical protein
MLDVFGFVDPADFSIEGMPARAVKGHAIPTSEYTWAIAASNNEGDYTTRHNGSTATGCNCPGGLHDQYCLHQMRLDWHLSLRAARLKREREERERNHFSQTSQLAGTRKFSLFR